MAFATVDEVRALWPGATATDDQIDAKVRVASAYLRSLYPTIPDDVLPAGLADTLMGVTVAMVKRSMLSDSTDNVESFTRSAGQFQESRKFRNSEGNLYLTAQEREIIESALAGVGAGRRRGMRTVEATGW